MSFQDRRIDGARIVTVDRTNHLPVIRFETLIGVVGKPAFDFAVNRNAVVIVENNQLAQTQSTRQRTYFVADAFHQTTVACKYVGSVIDHLMLIAVELGRQNLLSQRHTNAVSQTLAQGTGGGFDARSIAVLGVSGCATVQLTELLKLVNVQIVAGQVQQAIKQH